MITALTFVYLILLTLTQCLPALDRLAFA